MSATLLLVEDNPHIMDANSEVTVKDKKTEAIKNKK